MNLVSNNFICVFFFVRKIYRSSTINLIPLFSKWEHGRGITMKIFSATVLRSSSLVPRKLHLCSALIFSWRWFTVKHRCYLSVYLTWTYNIDYFVSTFLKLHCLIKTIHSLLGYVIYDEIYTAWHNLNTR